jgi:hypothetical protein
MHTDELRVALLRTWEEKGLDWPVYGVLDIEELAIHGVTTLRIEGGRWCEVKAADVRILAEVSLDEDMAADWMGEVE